MRFLSFQLRALWNGSGAVAQRGGGAVRSYEAVDEPWHAKASEYDTREGC